MKTYKSLLKSTASGAALLVATSAISYGAEESSAHELLEEIQVTGTRIVRDGYSAPTPVTVLGAEQIGLVGGPSLAEAVGRLPALARSREQESNNQQFTGGGAGASRLGLRGLGVVRTLVLLDGKRVPEGGFAQNAGVDINAFPSGLVSRVDVVSGGASAVYGSDALAGVINFVLDKEYTGIKGTVEGGVTEYSDNNSLKVDLTGGTPFAGGRGHALFYGELTTADGIPHNNRPWARNAYIPMQNPDYGTGPGQSTSVPQYVVRDQASASSASWGGLALSGPLAGTEFIQGGVPRQFNFGLVDGNNMSGGDWRFNRHDDVLALAPDIERSNTYTRLSFDLTDNVTAYGEMLWSKTHVITSGMLNLYYGNVLVEPDNAFIPAEIQSQVTEPFVLGTLNGDIGPIIGDTERVMRRYVGGLEGTFDALGSSWKWDAYYAKSSHTLYISTANDAVESRFYQAADAVRNAQGVIVCRSTLTNPNDGCIPYNVMGVGVNSAAAIDYVTDGGLGKTEITQDVASVTLTGEPFSTWAGPVFVALNAEHRKDQSRGTVSELSNSDGLWGGNFKATNGEIKVTEGAVETLIPLAKDTSWSKALDLTLAGRFTDYSTSGSVTTWKSGLNFQMNSDLRLRTSYSRDIRAPNIGELFSEGTGRRSVVVDPQSGNELLVDVLTVGNANLTPEIANTLGVGLVYTSSWIDGLNASIDYYDVDIEDALTLVAAQDSVDRCSAGETVLCQNVIRDEQGDITGVLQQNVNLVAQRAQGVDFEVSYGVPLADLVSSWPGSLALRGLATYALKSETTDGDLTTDGVGALSPLSIAPGFYLAVPKVSWNVQGAYTINDFTAAVTLRGVSDYHYAPEWIGCTTNCPESTPNRVTISDNRISGRTYADLALSYKPTGAFELYFSVQNLFDKGPPPAANDVNFGVAVGPPTTVLTGAYDSIGRRYRAGFRFSL